MGSTMVLTGGQPANGTTETITTVSIGDAAVVEGNSNARTVMVPVTLSNPLPTRLRVQFQTVAGTAKAGSDYTAKTGSIAIAAGKTAVNISVSVKGDTNAEPDEQLTVRLTGTDDAGVALDRTDGTITMLDDDTGGGSAVTEPGSDGPDATVSIGDVTVVEGNAGKRTVVLPMTLSEPLADPVVVRYATRTGSATAPADFRSKTGSTSIGAGKVFGTISIVTVADDLDEPDESFTVSLTSTDLAGTSIARSEGQVTILDDDTPTPVRAGRPARPYGDAGRRRARPSSGWSTCRGRLRPTTAAARSPTTSSR